MTEKKYPNQTVLPTPLPRTDTGKILLKARTRTNTPDPTVAGPRGEEDWRRIMELLDLNLKHRIKGRKKKRGREALKGLFGGGK